MAVIRKEKGYFYVKANRKPGSWSLYYEHYESGIKKQERVEPMAYSELGLRADMSLADARSRVKRINKERKIAKTKIRAAGRVVELRSMNELYFPAKYITAFQEQLETENFGSERHLKKIISHFAFIQKMIPELKLSPREYQLNNRRIYKYFVKKKLSVDYSHKIIGLLNRWGTFIARTEGSFFEPIKAPNGQERSIIAEAQKTKRGVDTELGVRTESLPLKPDKLMKVKDKFPSEAQANWLLISVWFGLRPAEVDELHGKRWSIEETVAYGKKWKVLKVYQSKLSNLREQDRYKAIPAIYPEQIECLKVIESGNFKRPLSKTTRRVLGENITLYGGRKGFTDLMLDRGQTLENISIWMGHTSINRTWRDYKDRKTVQFLTPEAAANKTKAVG